MVGMQFIKSTDSSPGSRVVLERLRAELHAGKNVLWLMCGGSNIADEASILKDLLADTDASRLHVMLMDERFGPVGHSDSNWQQLVDVGCNFKAVQITPVLTETEQTLAETVAAYEVQVARAMDKADVIIGYFGMGVDGHTAGILPNTPAALETTQLVAGYESPPFVRITMTRPALLRIAAAYVFAFGDAKIEALNRLHANAEPFESIPAKLFRELPEAYIYNDQIGDE